MVCQKIRLAGLAKLTMYSVSFIQVLVAIQLIVLPVFLSIYLTYRLFYYKKVAVQLKSKLSKQLSRKTESKALNKSSESLEPEKIEDKEQHTINNLLEKISLLQEQLATSEMRISNLEKFRKLYLNVSAALEAISEIQEYVNSNIDDIEAPTEVADKLRIAFEKLNEEKLTLESHIEQVQSQLDVMLGDGSAPQPPEENSEEIIKTQKQEINKLTSLISNLEVESNSIIELSDSVTALTETSEELTIAVEVLQEENTFLQEQIQGLLQQQVNGDSTFQEKIKSLEQEIADKEEKYNELNKSYAEMEADFIKHQDS